MTSDHLHQRKRCAVHPTASGTFERLEDRLFPAITFTVSFDDPGQSRREYYTALEQNVLAAGAKWSQYLAGNAAIDVVIEFSNAIPRATGGNETVVFHHVNQGVNVYQVGTVAEINSGIDPNGVAPDIRITIGNRYLVDELWLDPTPFSEADSVPTTKTDAVSVFMHELGHGLGFIGYGDLVDGSLPGTTATLFDDFTIFENNQLYFNGPHARDAYGGPVPLTFGNHFHVGNPSPRPGGDLTSDLMNGVSYLRGTRYSPTAIDLAILRDLEVPISNEIAPNQSPQILPQSFSVTERKPVGMIVGTVTATDSGLNQFLTFSIVDGNEEGVFKVDPMSGAISVADNEFLEFALHPQFVLTLEVADNGAPRRTASGPITITLTPLVVPRIIPSTEVTSRQKGSVTVIDRAIRIGATQDFQDVLGTRLEVAISEGAREGDQLVLVTAGEKSQRLRLRNGTLKRGKVIIASTTGDGLQAPLEVTFLSTATVDDLTLVLRNLAIRSQRTASGQRTVRYQLLLENGNFSQPAMKQLNL